MKTGRRSGEQQQAIHRLGAGAGLARVPPKHGGCSIFPGLADAPTGPSGAQFPWDERSCSLRGLVARALTGVPIVDAAMRQLNAKGLDATTAAA